MPKNSKLIKARLAKNNEFFTRLEDVAKELKHYWPQLKDKTILCNCNDGYNSAFVEYFARNGHLIGIRQMYGIAYNTDGCGYLLTYTPPEDVENYDADNWKDYLVKTRMTGNGGFETPESIELLDQCDVCITNPPFSIFSEFIDLLIQKEKKFLIIANQNCVTYKNIFPLFKDEKIWLGYVNMGTPEYFRVPDYYKETLINENKTRKEIDGEVMAKISTIWLTNLETTKRHEPMILIKEYYGHENDYPFYDNYPDVINVDKTINIPRDFMGVIGISISALDKLCVEQFVIEGMAAGNTRVNNFYYNVRYVQHPNDRGGCGVINGKRVYARILIRRRQEENNG